jgi:hypothetical protein
VIDLYRSC